MSKPKRLSQVGLREKMVAIIATKKVVSEGQFYNPGKDITLGANIAEMLVDEVFPLFTDRMGKVYQILDDFEAMFTADFMMKYGLEENPHQMSLSMMLRRVLEGRWI